MNLPPEQESIWPKCFQPSGTFIEFPKEEIETSIPQRFEKIVRLCPDRLAVKTGKQIVTYDELNRYANRIAHSIIEKRGRDIGPIALLLDNQVASIAAILGVLKSTNYYVFLDPKFPLERMRYILENSRVSLVIADSLSWARAQELNTSKLQSLNLDVLDLDTPDHDPGLAISADAPDALAYTSGSEGYPKGVIQSQRVSLYCYWAIALRRPCGISDRLSLVHSLSFESSKLQLHQALLSGAGLFPFDVQRYGIAQMAQWLEQEQITILHMPPALFRQLAEELPRPEKLRSLRLVYLSGAPVTKLDFELYKRHLPNHTSIGCHMASTEARAMCSAIIGKDFHFPERGTIAGYAFPDKEILLLDDNGNEVKNGEVGQIAVKSRYLNSSGYVNRPELTDAKFLSDTKNIEKDTFLTGDLGQKLPDGFLIHFGRMDRMLKIRGYRVELDEIERRLSQHPGIKQAAVTSWDRESGEKYLAAYLVGRDTDKPKIDQLQDFLRESLPAYMIPAAIVYLPELPLTNGKVDLMSLPKPDGVRPDLSSHFSKPANETEHRLVQIWEEVLDVHPIGVHDDFFDLGGHSLAATRVVSRVITEFQLEIPLQSLFQTPTIADMATVISAHQGKALDDHGLAAVLDELESMSDEDVEQLLRKQDHDVSKA